MDLAVYLVTAVIVTFAVGAAVGLWLSIAGGHWKNLDHAAALVLDVDTDPAPTRDKGAY